MPKLTLAMAVKNEAATIAHAIRSVAGIADRAVISVDSKDTQGTRAVAEAECTRQGLPVTFLEHVWEDNFSKMRNGVIDKIESMSTPDDWLLWIDGHEYLAPGHQHTLKNVVCNCPPDLWLWSFSLKMLDHDGNWRDSFMQAKMWRCGKGIRYIRAMHNQIDPDTCPVECRAGHQDIWIMHERTVENAEARAVQRDDLLPRLLAPKIEAGDEDALFHMLAHWFAKNNGEEFFKLFNIVNWDKTEILPDCQYQMRIYAAIMLQREAEKHDKASAEYQAHIEEAFYQLALAEQLTTDRNDHHMQRGRIYFSGGDYDKAYKHFEIASTYQLPVTQSFAQHDEYSWVPYASMANCLELSGNVDGAWSLYHAALARGGNVAGNIVTLEAKAPKIELPAGIEDKPVLVVFDKLNQFSRQICEALRAYYTVIVETHPTPTLLNMADAIWCEWVDENLIQVSQIRRRVPVIARLHGYEAIERDYPAQVRWENVDALIGVSRQMLDYTEKRFGHIPTRKVVISNGLNLEKFTYRERAHGKNVAFVSLLNNKKNIGTVVQIAREFPDYTFHISGKWQDARLKEYFEHAKERGCNNLIYAGWHSDVDGFLEDKDFLLNTSLWESFSFAVHEAMAKGIKPLVHDWVGIDEFIPDDLRWRTVGDLRRLLEGPYEAKRYRDLCQRYDVRSIAAEFHKLIESLSETEKEAA